MGKFFSCINKQSQNPDDRHTQMDFDTTSSITNISQFSTGEAVTTLSVVSSETTSPSTKFSWHRLQNIYTTNLGSSSKLMISPATLAVMKNIFNVIERNIGSMSRLYYECLMNVDKTFPTYFEECAGRYQKSCTGEKVLIERLRRHTLSMIHLHCRIINYLENPFTDEAYNIMRLIAVSHSLIRVAPQYFAFMDVVMGKFLLRAGLLSDGNAQDIVTYFNFISGSITTYMQGETLCDPIANCNKARENYRKMKDWYALVDSLREEISQLKDVESSIKAPVIPIELSQQSTIATAVLKQEACLIKHFIKKKVKQDK